MSIYRSLVTIFRSLQILVTEMNLFAAIPGFGRTTYGYLAQNWVSAVEGYLIFHSNEKFCFHECLILVYRMVKQTLLAVPLHLVEKMI